MPDIRGYGRSVCADPARHTWRQDAEAKAAAIGHDRAFTHPEELAEIKVPTLVIPGDDVRHPRELAAVVAEQLPQGKHADVGMTADLRTADDLTQAFAPAIRAFLGT